MLCPTLRSEQNGAGALDEEHTQIAISALRDAAKDRAITGRHLFRHQAKPRGKVSPFCKGSSIADCRDRGAMIGPMPGTVINCPQFTSVRARASISSVTLSMRSSRYFQSSTMSPIILSIRATARRCAWPRVVATVAAGTELLAARECRVPEESHGAD
jgi:hypothetical protein